MSRSSPIILTASLVLASTSLHAQDRMVLDYRDAQFRMAMPGSNAAERRRIAAAMRAEKTEQLRALGEDFAILGDAQGELAKAGEVDLHLISSEQPVAIEPFPDRPGQVILAMKGDRAVGSYNLPKDVQFTRIVGAVDLDDDGSSEVLLEANSMNMGEMHTAVYAIHLEEGHGTSVLQTVSGAFVDTCEAPHGDKSRIAMSISVEGGQLRGTPHMESCG